MFDPIAMAIPGFVALMGAEIVVSAAKGRLRGNRPTWRPVDAIGDLATGITSQATGVLFTGVLAVGAYVWVWEHLTPARLPSDALWVWVAAFVLYDFVYYLWHWASHRINFMWAAHQVHHQSEDFNLAVALRQSMLTPITSLPFGLAMVMVGFPPEVMAGTLALNTVGQFWFHTRLIGRMGPFEAVLNTPSHHRVHHGINPAYIDKNHAGIFIVWDKLFGTFQAEVEEPVYGVVEGFLTANPWRANIDPWVKLLAQWRASVGRERLYLWVAPPEWRPAALGGPVVIPEPEVALRWDPKPSWGRVVYVLVWVAVAVAVLAALLPGVLVWPASTSVVVAGFVLGSGLAWGGLLDERSWSVPVELVRLGTVPWVLSLALGVPWAASYVLVVLSFGGLFVVQRSERSVGVASAA